MEVDTGSHRKCLFYIHIHIHIHCLFTILHISAAFNDTVLNKKSASRQCCFCCILHYFPAFFSLNTLTVCLNSTNLLKNVKKLKEIPNLMDCIIVPLECRSQFTACILTKTVNIIFIGRTENLCHMRVIVVMHRYFSTKDHKEQHSSIAGS